jgi:hypothetical protein
MKKEIVVCRDKKLKQGSEEDSVSKGWVRSEFEKGNLIVSTIICLSNRKDDR